MKKIRQQETTQSWIPLEDICDNGIMKTKSKYIKILKVTPINYNLKSDLEKQSIINSYKIFLKTCNFDIQILIQSSKENLEKNIFNIQKNIQKKENKYLKKISENYIEYINKINSSKKSSSKNFYIIISKKIPKEEYNESYEIIKNDLKEKYFKIKECLSRCGNSVFEVNTKKEVLKILNSFLNTRKELILKNNQKEDKQY
ncbi:MAG: hypothetical protein HFJ35_04050 [Clostridia bacterium]|nr:hypothetical protein [Clostridia bacterium]